MYKYLKLKILIVSVLLIGLNTLIFCSTSLIDSVSLDTLQELDHCAQRNISLKGITEKSIQLFKDYCSQVFKKSEQLPLALFSFNLEKSFNSSKGWSVEHINDARQHRITRAKNLLVWLQKNYIPKKSLNFFYLTTEPYLFGWNMSKKIQNELSQFLDSVPLLISCNHPDLPWTKKAILIPDDFILADGFHSRIEELLENKLYGSIHELDKVEVGGLAPFIERKSTIYFRGALSGPRLPFTLENIKQNPRHYIFMVLNNFPYLDVKITGDQELRMGGDFLDYMRKNFYHLKSPRVDFFEHAKNKYLLSMDGFGAAWSRVQLIMATGSVLFLNAQCEQYFYQLMEPGKTHIVINRDFSNLDDEYRRLEANPNHAEKIGNQGKAFVRKFFSKKAIDAYLWLVLNKIEKYSFTY